EAAAAADGRRQIRSSEPAIAGGNDVAAFTLVELLFALGVAATLAAVSIPQITASMDDVRASAAARLVAATLQQTRMEAVRRGRATAVRFRQTGAGYEFAVYVDGNRNGAHGARPTAEGQVGAGERRRQRRASDVADHGIVCARVRPGHAAIVVDVSPDGALIDTSHRLLPGTMVVLHFESVDRRESVRGR